MPFDVIDQFWGPGFVLVLHVNLCRDEDVRRTEMDGLNVDEPADFRSVERGLDACQIFLCNALADEQTVEFTCEEEGCGAEQYADQHTRQCIVERIACEMAQEHTGQRYQQTNDGCLRER